MKLNNSVALVTGSASGIGRGIALEMAREGANIVVADKNLEGARNVANEILRQGRDALVCQVDVSRSEEVNALVKTSLEHYGHIDILVNNAGGSARERTTSFRECTEEVWDYVIGINLKGVFNCSRALINHMIERHHGIIINIASISGIVGMPRRADYSAAKGGIIAFTKALAQEVATDGVRVVAISPGVIETPMVRQASQEQKEGMLIFKNVPPVGRVGQPEDIAHMAVFLASEEASYIIGHNFILDGGTILRI